MDDLKETSLPETIFGFLRQHLLSGLDVFEEKSLFRCRMYVLLLGVLLAGCEIRSIDPETGEVIIEERQPAFNASEYVDGIWQEQVMPIIREEAVDLVTLLSALNSNDPNLAEQYRYHKDNQPDTFLIKGEGKVIEVDTTSRVGFLKVDIPPIGENPSVKLQIGPVISGTALRDALPFIKFDQFTNQMEYAAVSKAMHDRLIDTELSALDYSEFEGNIIRFYGAFLYEDGQAVITPVKIEMTD